MIRGNTHTRSACTAEKVHMHSLNVEDLMHVASRHVFSGVIQFFARLVGHDYHDHLEMSGTTTKTMMTARTDVYMYPELISRGA